ncbi:aromatic acid exporter family protein [Bacillus sp. V3B]|uniref:aromatic acid exporter family protein n=1 Tax=Bacillus sp. V3B TaxID=2804915 RepID=UPI00210DF85A|nr:aromatic acid exporter family protein [Bacillus sp. V3B]MCQ6274812.1 aromatic acid exporter family protein [Bacillus sp. V3B]
MKIPKRYKFVGGRIIKTGIAVFVTASICHLLNWPAMFAVITAIVTIEPTAADSIKKAFIRFPASAIGAAFSILFTFIFGDSPLSYTLVTVCTIIACTKLKLYDGMLVATLTGIAMITTVHDQYVSSFFIRLGTTSTGLIVSSLVNLLVIPPKYSQTITSGIHTLFMNAGDILYKRGNGLFDDPFNEKELQQAFEKLINDIEKMRKLCHYQKEEWRFHRSNREDIREYLYVYKKLTILQHIAYHIGNFIFLPSHHLETDQQKTEMVKSAIQSLRRIFCDEKFHIQEEDQAILKEMTEWFSEQRSLKTIEELLPEHHHHISTETTILYELISIYDLVEELSHIHDLEIRHKTGT